MMMMALPASARAGWRRWTALTDPSALSTKLLASTTTRIQCRSIGCVPSAWFQQQQQKQDHQEQWRQQQHRFLTIQSPAAAAAAAAANHGANSRRLFSSSSSAHKSLRRLTLMHAKRLARLLKHPAFAQSDEFPEAQREIKTALRNYQKWVQQEENSNKNNNSNSHQELAALEQTLLTLVCAWEYGEPDLLQDTSFSRAELVNQMNFSDATYHPRPFAVEKQSKGMDKNENDKAEQDGQPETSDKDDDNENNKDGDDDEEEEEEDTADYNSYHVDIWERNPWTGQITGYVTNTTAAERKRNREAGLEESAPSDRPLNFYTRADLNIYETDAYFAATMIQEGMVPFDDTGFDDLTRIDFDDLQQQDDQEAEFEMALVQALMKLALQAKQQQELADGQDQRTAATRFPPLPQSQVLTSSANKPTVPLLAPHVREFLPVEATTLQNTFRDAIQWWQPQRRPFDLQLAPIADGGGGGQISGQDIHFLASDEAAATKKYSAKFCNPSDVAFWVAMEVALEYAKRLVAFHKHIKS